MYEEEDEMAAGLSRNMAVVNEENTGSATFSIPGLSTIPTGRLVVNQTHKVTITEVDLAAELEWMAVPKGAKNAFLQV